jgi:ATP-binding cassette, subfamily B, bacterial
MQANNEKPKYKQNVTWMIEMAYKNNMKVLIFCLLTASLEVTLNLIQLYIAPVVLNKVEQGVSIKELLLSIVLFTASLFIVQGLNEYIKQNTLFPRVDVRSAIIGMISNKCNRTSYPNTLDDNFIKLREKAYQACSGNDEASEHIFETLTMLLKNIGGLLIYLTILSRINIVLLLLIIVTSIISYFASRYADDWRYKRRKQEEEYFQKKQYISNKAESVELAKDIRIFGLQNWLNEILNQTHNLYLDFCLSYEKKEILSDIVTVVLAMLRNCIAYVYLINMALNNELSISKFLLYISAITTFTEWIIGILKELNTLHKESLDISSIREFLDYAEPFKFKGGKDIPESSTYELKLENVSFSYPNINIDTIHNLSLTIKAGEKLAIVGLNGAGKTTLVKLICGLLDPSQGRVLLNGVDIKEFNREKYYDLFSAVFQDFSILDVTVAQEIAQCKDDIDYDKVLKCIDLAGLNSVIKKLPNGLNTHIGREVYLDGVLFSGGQMQRLMLARALYKDGPILLLDEPTAALDPIAENDIYLKYSQMSKNKTSLFISHRLASTRFCDRIIFLGDGAIKEEGTHDSLLALNGEYAKLFEIQSRYYQEGKEY